MSKVCGICGKQIKFLTDNLKFKDGYLDGNCLAKLGLSSTRFSDIGWSEEHTIDEAKELINNNIKIDSKAEKAKLKEQKKINKAENKAKYETIKKRYIDHKSKISGKMHADFVDEMIYFEKTLFTDFREISFDDVVSFTPIERGKHESKHHRGARGLVGGVLAGGVGAVIGASTGGKDYDILSELSILIILKNGDNYKLKYLNTETKADSWTSKLARSDFENGISILSNIVAKNNSTAKYENTVVNSGSLEIRELKSLLDDGIITQSEFDMKKKQILGL